MEKPIQQEKKKSTGQQDLTGRVIVQVLPALNHGGVERGCLEVAKAIINQGGQAVVISSGGKFEEELKSIGGVHYTLPVHCKNPLRWRSIRRQVREVLSLCNGDIVHIRSRAPAWIAMKAARALALPVITTIHGRFVATSRFKRYYNSIMTKGDHIIAISHYISDLVRQQFPYAADKMTVIHRGVDIEVFNANAVSEARLDAMRDRLQLPHSEKVVMLPSRGTAWKGMSVLIEAMGMLAEHSFILLLVGAGGGNTEMLTQLKQDAAVAKITDKVRFCDAVDDMPAALMLADVVVMPSVKPEPFGRVALEASAIGRPIVAFRHGGAMESIVEGRSGWLAEPIEADSLARAIKTAIDLNEKERRTLAQAARVHVKEHFSTEKMCTATLELYVQLLANGKKKL